MSIRVAGQPIDDLLSRAGLSKETLAAAYAWEESGVISHTGPFQVSGVTISPCPSNSSLRHADLFYTLHCISGSEVRFRRSFLPVEIHFSNFEVSCTYFTPLWANRADLSLHGARIDSCNKLASKKSPVAGSSIAKSAYLDSEGLFASTM